MSRIFLERILNKKILTKNDTTYSSEQRTVILRNIMITVIKGCRGLSPNVEPLSPIQIAEGVSAIVENDGILQ